jgi:ligand-binding SRPBCC domain-containing protein
LVNRLEFAQWVPFPLERVFLFFADPGNLPRIMPGKMDTRIEHLALVSPPPAPASNLWKADRALAGVGSEIVTSFRISPLLPFRRQWIARITEFEWNHHFCDVQVRGPFASWRHRHELAEEVRNGIEGTRVRDGVEYEIGFGPLGAVAERLFVRRQMQTTFAHRQNVLEGLLRENESETQR